MNVLHRLNNLCLQSFYDTTHSAEMSGGSSNLDTVANDNQRTAEFTYSTADWDGAWSGVSCTFRHFNAYKYIDFYEIIKHSLTGDARFQDL